MYEVCPYNVILRSVTYRWFFIDHVILGFIFLPFFRVIVLVHIMFSFIQQLLQCGNDKMCTKITKMIICNVIFSLSNIPPIWWYLVPSDIFQIICHSGSIKVINIKLLNTSPSKDNTHTNENICLLIILQSSMRYTQLFKPCFHG